MSIHDILSQVHSELSLCTGWESDLCGVARKRILELFAENDIPETAYEPWMGNNVLPTISLK